MAQHRGALPHCGRRQCDRQSFADEPDALRSFTSEAAGLDLRVAGPAVLGVDTDVPLLVMEDLGEPTSPG
ncbi:hypothetical protein [Streptomyces sp. NPDC058755]|uniref:hypothetical protein n=1 Tax=Streptomyces sp. NPDC058755 TaxID=3346624 RepID=UPI0036CFFF4A